MTYRTILKSATNYKFGEGWYFDGDTKSLYEGSDKAAAIAAYDAIDMPSEAAYCGTAVSREVVEVAEDGEVIGTAMRNAQAMGSDLCEIHDGAEGWWIILSERSSQVSSRDERLYRIDSFKGAYYVALFQPDNRYARQILAVHADNEDMEADVEARGISEYLTADELKSIGMEVEAED